MLIWIALIGLILFSLAAYSAGRRKVLRASGGSTRVLHSLPGYYGAYVALWAAAPAAIGGWMVKVGGVLAAAKDAERGVL